MKKTRTCQRNKRGGGKQAKGHNNTKYRDNTDFKNLHEVYNINQGAYRPHTRTDKAAMEPHNSTDTAGLNKPGGRIKHGK